MHEGAHGVHPSAEVPLRRGQVDDQAAAGVIARPPASVCKCCFSVPLRDYLLTDCPIRDKICSGNRNQYEMGSEVRSDG